MYLFDFAYIWNHVFFFQNEATFPLVRKDYYKKIVQGAYTQMGESPSEQVQENEISYLAYRADYLM